MKAAKVQKWSSQETHVGADYDAEELEFLKAVDRHRRATGRPFPSCRDFLRILRSLGWRKARGGEENKI